MVDATQDGRRFFWIASYPRSGNTLVRITLSQILRPPEDARARVLNRNFPEYIPGKPFPIEGRPFAGRHGQVVFVKTHSPKPADGVPWLGAIYLVRHPIDVFLSGMNYLFIEHEKFEWFRRFFGQDGPQPVERLAESGKLDAYLDRFVARQGLPPFQPYSGTWVENVRQWTGCAQPETMIIRFDELVRDLSGTMWQLLECAGITVAKERFEFGIRRAIESTRVDGRFFWRGSTDTKRAFFSAPRIKEVESIFRPLVGDGYF
jgi:hypothetical protein